VVSIRVGPVTVARAGEVEAGRAVATVNLGPSDGSRVGPIGEVGITELAEAWLSSGPSESESGSVSYSEELSLESSSATSSVAESSFNVSASVSSRVVLHHVFFAFARERLGRLRVRFFLRGTLGSRFCCGMKDC
jgi:hypothetical protein